jgi:hypothetical protein
MLDAGDEPNVGDQQPHVSLRTNAIKLDAMAHFVTLKFLTSQEF